MHICIYASQVRELFCPKEGSKLIMAFVSSLMLLAGIALTGVMAVAIFGVSVHSYVTLVAVEVKAFLDESALYMVFIVGMLLLSVSLVRVRVRIRVGVSLKVGAGLVYAPQLATDYLLLTTYSV